MARYDDNVTQTGVGRAKSCGSCKYSVPILQVKVNGISFAAGQSRGSKARVVAQKNFKFDVGGLILVEVLEKGWKKWKAPGLCSSVLISQPAGTEDEAEGSERWKKVCLARRRWHWCKSDLRNFIGGMSNSMGRGRGTAHRQDPQTERKRRVSEGISKLLAMRSKSSGGRSHQSPII
ncbi:hypothetical protein Cgig2_030277 [Carnegiea gigantea]|uniref:Uncharacterized protein n=1 Tax=Carnegiea gigantea TaxID=171969 RepID=A0A9Q1JNX3_9CARY|nr:hypothetical protein Cgig2_030277 [Carnegiea gigantea]